MDLMKRKEKKNNNNNKNSNNNRAIRKKIKRIKRIFLRRDRVLLKNQMMSKMIKIIPNR